MTQNNWGVADDGSITQSLSDMQDSDIRLFSEVASWHNQAIKDGTEGPAKA